ncbi:UEV-domain-containing protein [Coniophora puteana RWD-64-598 SS2]|uniref:UEV-domain-containing protein n=1 Tax=Coniophora puteana (strain RWD-64-598) TaxID=741705 RepID=A0A5M3N1G5_CONPW|nr:UEV-domain-containing protein [Coniophora puteana RWD-64-598 SS2]EIW85218.1 UEV-domain-containing protein [Coniophora puteana RWD-64-598 SS2]
MSSESLTQKWLRQNVAPYPHKDRVYVDIDAALSRFTTLRPKSDVYTYDDGRSQLLLCLHGTLPITFRGTTYNIPIAVWIAREYPRRPPIAYVVPTQDMLVRSSKHVDVSGRCLTGYIQDWERKSESCNLSALLESMQAEFSRGPPVYAKPKQTSSLTQQVSPAPSPIHSTRPAGVESALDSSPSSNRPTLPPKPVSSSSPPVPPRPASEHYDAASPTANLLSRPPPPPPPLPPTDTQTPPPVFRSPDGYAYSTRMHHQASSYAWPSYLPASATQSPAPAPTALPQTGPATRSAPAPPPVPPQYSTSGTGLALQPPNLLEEEEVMGTESQVVGQIAAPPRPPNPELLHLHTQVQGRINSELASLSHAMIVDAERLRAQQADLLAGEPAIRDEMARLEAVRDVCRGVSSRLRAVVDRGESNVSELRRKGDPEVDELVCSTSIVHNQLINLVAEDNAIEDTIYHLHRALNSGRIDLERFLRTTRIMAEEQFLKRALIEKIKAGLPMGMSYS